AVGLRMNREYSVPTRIPSRSHAPRGNAVWARRATHQTLTYTMPKQNKVHLTPTRHKKLTNSVRHSVTQRGALILHSHAARGNENTSGNKQQAYSVWQQQTCEVSKTSQVLTLNRVNPL
ncbi:MAG: hypothetical protein Q8Q54_15700, partial [Methylococcales bacterium]|nr:hypothetical protein [Methylococcales bacterium]